MNTKTDLINVLKQLKRLDSILMYVVFAITTLLSIIVDKFANLNDLAYHVYQIVLFVMLFICLYDIVKFSEYITKYLKRVEINNEENERIQKQD